MSLMMVTSQAQGDVLRERERQFYEERWTDEHDDQHDKGQLAFAGAAYALAAAIQAELVGHGKDPKFAATAAGLAKAPAWWPFSTSWWKPKDRRRDLVRAAALIIAEIERLDRAEAKGGQ
jgi:hypothetical protein